MSQRVVVLTEEEIGSLLHPMSVNESRVSAMRKLTYSLEHPEGITDDMVARARMKARELSEAEDDEIAVVLETDDWESHVARQSLEAALFPGEDNE